jgi:zinc/manganese transport system substrate-binding protein
MSSRGTEQDMKRIGLVSGMAIAATLALAACGSSSDSGNPGRDEPSVTNDASGACPVAPVQVVVTVNQWGDIVETLGGGCVEVTTIISGGDVDPHDFEPTPADSAAFEEAELVVMNGLDYDPWVDKAIDTLDDEPATVNGGEVVGLHEGDNPHIWYGPDYVYEVADAVTARLRKLSPASAAYFDDRHDAWRKAMAPYDAEIARITPAATGKTYGATEGVFGYMARAVGLVDDTPRGYRNAAANESDPAPGDVDEFQRALARGAIDVLVFNTQTEGALPDQIRAEAERAEVPVVDVTETVPPGARSFLAWQVGQLRSLARALGA